MGTSILVWSVVPHDGAARVVKPAGKIDESTATPFGERLAEEIEVAAADGLAKVVVDLSHIEYMSSRGLRGLTLGQRKASEHKVAIVLAQPNDIMREILAISRYDKVFKVFDSVAEAVAG